MKVADILKSKRRAGSILSVKSTDKVAEAVELMVDNDTGSVVVYNESQRFMGMLTFREVLITLHKSGYQDGPGMQCGNIVDKENRNYVTDDDSIEQVRKIMTDNHIRYLPVMKDEKLTDVISFYDVARTIAKAANYENRLLKEYIRNWPEAAEDDDSQ